MEERLIEELVEELAGTDVIPLIRLILGKKDVNEFKIAEKLGLTINQVRNMLYRLSNHNLVYSTRKKDKKKGWYVYYWTLDMKKISEMIIKLKEKRLEQLKIRLQKERTDTYYSCPEGCVRFNSQNAMEYSFRCPECGELLKQEDREKGMKHIVKWIKQTKEDLELEREKVRKEAEKRAKAEEREREKAKKLAQKARKKKKVKKKIKKKKKKVKKKKVKRKPKRKKKPKKKFKRKKSKKKIVSN